jgi:hypothetical protein
LRIALDVFVFRDRDSKIGLEVGQRVRSTYDRLRVRSRIDRNGPRLAVKSERRAERHKQRGERYTHIAPGTLTARDAGASLVGGFEDADRENSWPTDLARAPADLTSQLEIGETLHELFDRDLEFEPSKIRSETTMDA